MQAAKAWIQSNPDELAGWLDGVQTLDGETGLDAVRAALGL
jgi:glycine betaine/proline transport system substrate-binding protein